MQSCVQNITTVRYLLNLRANIVTSPTVGQWTATSLDVNVFLYIVVLFFGGVI